MNTRTLGIIAGVIGSAVGTFLWARQRTIEYRARQHARREQGTVIFSNTPTA